MVPVANETGEIVLSKRDLREVTGYAAESAQEALEIFERAHPADSRPRDAIDAAWKFARAAEPTAGGDRDVGADHIERARRRATPIVVDVLSRYPAAPPGGGRVGKLLRDLDGALRGRS
jgi:hypothetical protein